MSLLIFVVSFLILFLVSRFFTVQLGHFLMMVTRSHTASIYILALLFFPGVLIHELGHFFMASILFVPTGEIEFLPKVQEGGIKLGSVAIAQTDPFRRFLIGVAPVLSGVGILLLASYYLHSLWPITWQTWLFIYILFEIGNTMFSSKKDLEGAIGLLVFVGFIAGCFFLLGARIPTPIVAWLKAFASLQIFLQISVWLGASSLLNGIFWILLKSASLVRR